MPELLFFYGIEVWIRKTCSLATIDNLNVKIVVMHIAEDIHKFFNECKFISISKWKHNRITDLYPIID